MKKLKLWLKRYWNLMLANTTIDEKVIETTHEVKRRAKRVKEEFNDVVDQAEDVIEAAKGKKRSGRKPKKK